MRNKIIGTLSIIATLLAIVGGLWAFDGRYSTNTRVDHFEVQVAGALQNQQMKSDVQFFSMMIERLTVEKNSIRREINKYPNDHELKQDYKDIQDEINRFKQLLDQALRKIN